MFWRRYFIKSVTWLQALADFSTVVACYLASYWFYTGPLKSVSPQALPEFAIFSMVAGLLYVLLLEREGLYRREISLLNVKELRGIFYIGIYASAVILSATFYLRFASFSRITLTLALISTPVFIYLQRQLFYRFHVLFHQHGLSRYKVLIYGAGNIGQHLAKRLFESPSLGLLPIGFLDDDERKYGKSITWKGTCPPQGLKVLGGEEVIKPSIQKGVNAILIALPSATFDRNQKLVEFCNEQRIEYAIVPNSYEKFIQGIEGFEIGGIPLLRRRERKQSFYYVFIKRLIDFALSALFLLVLLPLFTFIAIAIKVNSKGPVIFKHKRVGLRGRTFSLYKFRSMQTSAPKYSTCPEDPTDPRITKVGRWLRRTSLDELPQLFNVLRGDMSLVGPRPEMPFIVEKYGPLEKQRLEVKPGITGVWQISAFRGEPIHTNIEYDLFYLDNRSILLDLAVIVKTILSVVRGIGAV